MVQTIRPSAGGLGDGGWWAEYERRVGRRMGATARRVLDADCEYILRKGVLGAGRAGEPAWPADRVRTGLVMGAVQSGKTASMLGVVAKALDEGVDIVVVLAGTRIGLWRQTYERLRSQLDVEPSADVDGARRILVPGPAAVTEVLAPRDLYRVTTAQGARVVRGEVPLVAVVMKHDAHLQALARRLREQVARTRPARPLHLLVVDDEADDGSILDPAGEGSGAQTKQIPRQITQLWSPGLVRGHTHFWDRLHVTYVAYTATPQANILQAEYNPLSPRHFLAVLRTPGPIGDVEPRSLTFAVPGGVARHYTGGEHFYVTHRDMLCRPIEGVAPATVLGDALRAYFVAGAMKVAANELRDAPTAARSKVYLDADQALSLSPQPHSMLIHPSAQVADHFDEAARVLAWCNGLSHKAAVEAIAQGCRSLSGAHLSELLNTDDQPWRQWYDDYASAALRIDALEGRDPRVLAPWETVRRLLHEEVFPTTRLSVVNSDPQADDRPSFLPERAAGGRGWRAPTDLGTIFVSGNVMARGLTLEGLTTTLFERRSGIPLADTQMQMQRWFGYRGQDLHLTRLFIEQHQLDLFARYHEGDVAIRKQIVHAMRTDTAAPRPAVFGGAAFRATGKVAGLRNRPLHPGKAPYFAYSNGADDPNNATLAGLFAAHESADVVVGGVHRGRILARPIGVEETADLLDSLDYAGQIPWDLEPERERWEAVARLVGAPRGSTRPPLFRGPGSRGDVLPPDLGARTPYSAAAYLRLWAAAHSSGGRGLLAVVSPGADQIAEVTQPPRFWVGLRYGSGDRVEDGPWRGVGFAPATSERQVDGPRVVGEWGSRSPGAEPHNYAADEYFDYYHRGEAPPAWVGSQTGWRPPGSDGLLLFQLVEAGAGRLPAVCFGLAVPLGGPSQYPVIRDGDAW